MRALIDEEQRRLGDKAAALALSERGIAVLPIERDVVTGAAPIETLARVAAQTGEHDRAIAALQQVLSIPGTGALDKYMREVSREFPEKIGEVSNATLSAEAKQRLKEALRQ